MVCLVCIVKNSHQVIKADCAYLTAMQSLVMISELEIVNVSLI